MSKIEEAVQRHQRGDHEAAVRLCEELLKDAFDAIEPRILLAVIFEMADDHAQAAYQLNYALRTRPWFEKDGFPDPFGFDYPYLAERLKFNAVMAIEKGGPDLDISKRAFMSMSAAVADHILGHLDEAERRFRECMAEGFDPYMGLAGLAFVRQQRGDREGFLELVDYGAFPVTYDMAAEKGADAIAELNDAVFRAVIDHPSLVPEKHPEAARAKYITENFAAADMPGPVADVLALIEEKVERLRDTLTPVADHPFLGRIPKGFRYEIFGALLDAGGYHSPHVHTGCWVSGGYYARVPDLAADGADNAGCLEFGKPLFPPADGYQGARHHLTPSEGLLAVWPSHYIHNTVPCADARQRLTMGFNVYPVD